MTDASAVHEVFDKSPLVNGRKDFTGEEEPETHGHVNGRPRSWNLGAHQDPGLLAWPPLFMLSAGSSQQVVDFTEGVVGTHLNHPPPGPEPSL